MIKNTILVISLILIAVAIILGATLEKRRRHAIDVLISTGAVFEDWKGLFGSDERLDEIGKIRSRWLSKPKIIIVHNGESFSQKDIGAAINTLQPKFLVFHICYVIDDELMKSIGKTKSVQYLDFGGNDTVSDSNIRFLADMPNIEELIIESAQVSTKSIHLFKSMPKLKCLGIDGALLDNDKDRATFTKNYPGVKLVN